MSTKLLQRAWRVALNPTPRQASMLGRHSGAARWAFTFGLRRCREEREAGHKRPTAMDLNKEIVKLKHTSEEDGGKPWLKEVSKCAPQEALRDLDRAWVNFFAKRAGYPKFRSRRSGGRFALTGSVHADKTWVQLPRIGRVNVQPGERSYVPPGGYKTARVTEVAGRWYVSVSATAVEPDPPNGSPTIAIDRGVRKLGVLSDGTIIVNPCAEKRVAKRLRRAELAVKRKQRAADKLHGVRKKGERRQDSKRLRLARRRVARVKATAVNIRRDAIHKATTKIAKSAGTIVLEDLKVSNMTRRRKGKGRAAKSGLNRAILDAGWGEMRRQLDYKTKWYGSRLVLVNPAYTSQDCSSCGKRTNCGTNETYTCSACSMVMDRDQNAAKNLLLRFAAERVSSDAALGSKEAQNARVAAVRLRRTCPPTQAAVIREGFDDASVSK